MALLEGLFGGKHPNLEHIAQAIEASLGLTLVKPPPEVIRVLDAMTRRELVSFNNVRSVEGLQELFRVKSIRAVVDTQMHLVSLFLLAAGEIERQLKAEHAQVKVLKLEKLESTQKLSKPLRTPPTAQPIPLGQASTAAPLAPPVPGFENLEACERLSASLVDLFVRHGQLTTADKDVLRKIKPTDSSLEARIVALERWRAEMIRRVRALSVPKAIQHLILGATDETAIKPEETLARRFDALVHWLGKLVKAFEATGVRYHNKPMWLPH